MTNETLNVLKTRRSCRSFKDEMISEEELNAVLEAGMYAPTGKGKQAVNMICITNEEVRTQIQKENAKVGGFLSDMDPFYNAPVVIAVLANKTENPVTCINDASLVIGNMLNAAHSLGLGSIWIHRCKEEFESDWGKQLLKSLDMNDEYIGVGHVALGYKAKDDNEPIDRKDNYVRFVK